jgi:hypothetical protein
MSNLYRGPPIGVFYQVSVHLAQQFQRRRFSKITETWLEAPMEGSVLSFLKAE